MRDLLDLIGLLWRLLPGTSRVTREQMELADEIRRREILDEQGRIARAKPGEIVYVSDLDRHVQLARDTVVRPRRRPF